MRKPSIFGFMCKPSVFGLCVNHPYLVLCVNHLYLILALVSVVPYLGLHYCTGQGVLLWIIVCKGVTRTPSYLRTSK